MRARSVSSALLLLAGAAIAAPAASRAAESAARVRDPLPVEAAADTRGHNLRSPIALSPDGQWVAHTVETADTLPRATHQYTATGFPLAEGDSRMEATITNVKTGESIRLGGPKSSSWLGVWSPDGSKVAFYSDEGGEPGLWTWSFATRKAERFPGVMARPFFGYELVQWSADGKRLVCKVVPAGMTLAEITALGSSLDDERKFKKVSPGEPSVIVKTSEPTDKDKKKEEPKTIGDVAWGITDLAVLDLDQKTARRLIERENVRFYRISPDGSSVAATVLKGWRANSQQPTYDLVVVDLATGARRAVASEITLGYGIEWNWTPDSKSIAYIPSGIAGTEAAKDKGPIVVVSAEAAGGSPRTLKAPGVPSFDPGQGEYAPVMDEKGKNFYAVGDGELWRVDAQSGAGQAVGKIPGWKITALVQPFGRGTLLSPDGGRTVWVLARLAPPTAAQGIFAAYADGGKAGFFAIDLESGASRPLMQEAKSLAAIFNLDGSAKTGEIVFSATDQQHLHDLWVLGAKSGRARQVTHLNPEIEKYELGQARLLEWRSLTGQALKGSLLLPPGYKAGSKLPLVVFVYGGDYGSRYLNRFGFWSIAALNCHILASRGYAVLAPDAPIRPGMPMEDLMGTVMPGVNAAIDQGYADPDRLAVMGQSYGSYSVLALITQTNRFQAAIITAAVLHPDLFADYLGSEGSIGYYEKGQGGMGGTIWEQRDRYFRNSPIFLFDRIETPLMIGQGQNDGTLVPADAIFMALERLGKRAEYRLYEGEGHVITQRANVLDFWKARLDFLATNLNIAIDAAGRVEMDGNAVRAAKKPEAAPAAAAAAR